MPSVFLSYARENASIAESLAKGFSENGVSVWRDIDSLYAGEQWPKALGAAIADHGYFVLLWSQQGKDSEFVELEWNTALALKKPIIPCLLDDTPLPSALMSFYGIEFANTENTAAALLRTFGKTSRQTQSEENTRIIDKLSKISSAKPEEVLQQVKILAEQNHWTVQGSVYQVTGDVHIGNDPSAVKDQKSLLEKWQIWVGLMVGVLTAVTLAFQLNHKIASKEPETAQPAGQDELVFEQLLEGSIRDENNSPLAEVRVSLPRYYPSSGSTAITDRFGRFRLKAKAEKEAYVEFLAQKSGFKSYENDFQLGATALLFTMKRSAP